MTKTIGLYAALGLLAFLVATTGSDVFASMTLGNQRFGPALAEHFYWAGMEFIGTLWLLLPFAVLAVTGSWVQNKSSSLKGLTIFGLPALYLIYSYLQGYHASKVAELHHLWTAATVSIAFAPYRADCDWRMRRRVVHSARRK